MGQAVNGEEALQIIKPLLRDGQVDFAGKYYQARNCEDVPRGPRPAGPPLMVGTSGPRMLKLTAQYADLWNTGYMGKPETMAAPLATIAAACRAVGRDPQTQQLWNVAPEFASVQKQALAHSVPLKTVYAAALAAASKLT